MGGQRVVQLLSRYLALPLLDTINDLSQHLCKLKTEYTPIQHLSRFISPPPVNVDRETWLVTHLRRETWKRIFSVGIGIAEVHIQRVELAVSGTSIGCWAEWDLGECWYCIARQTKAEIKTNCTGVQL